MPYRSVLTTAQLDALLACPQTAEELAALYAFDARDRAFIRQHRGDHNRLGVAVQLCYLRYPGHALAPDSVPEPALLAFVAREVRVSPAVWADYARRDETRWEHALALQKTYGYVPFTTRVYRRHRALLTALALQTNKAAAIAQQFVETLRREQIIVPPAGVIDRLCAEALARGTRLFYQRLSAGLDGDQRLRLDRLLTPREDARTILLTWLRQPPGEAKARNILTHLDRLQALRAVGVPSDLAHTVHQTRLTQLAREGAQMSIQHLCDLEETRRQATLVALVLDTQATVIDQVLDMHDKVIGKLFAEAKRTHAATFADQGKAINEKVRQYSDVGQAVISARERGADPYAAIEAVLPWDRFTHSVAEAAQLARPASFDHPQFLTDGYSAVRRYAPRFLESLTFRAAPVAQKVLAACDTLRRMYASNARTMPKDAPTAFIKPRWAPYVLADDGVDRRFYELCALAELKNALRAGDVWVEGSRQFKAFEEYLLPPTRFAQLQGADELALAPDTAGERYLEDRLALLQERLAAHGELPDVTLTDELLKVTPLTKSVPEAAERLEEELFSLMPHVKVTELLLEVDRWTDFTRHFTHLRTGTPATDRAMVLTVLLADAIKLGLTKMAESCPGSTYHNQRSDDTPATVTQLAAALAALGHYEGTNSDAEYGQEATRLGGESYYRLLLANALLGHAEGEALHADGTGVSADQVLAAHRQVLAAVGALDDPAKLLGFLRWHTFWHTLRIAGPLRESAQDPATGPVVLAAAHAPRACSSLAQCAAGQEPLSLSPENLLMDLQAARDALTDAVANIDIMWRLLHQAEDLFAR